MTTATFVHGHVERGFEPLREAFTGNFVHHGEVGAAFALYAEGRKVVDLWGGTADPATGRPYEEDTLQLVFSSTKGATAFCAHLLAQRGQLDLDRPVVELWPEFGQAGKEHVPVRWLLSHRAGLPTIDRRLSYEDVLRGGPLVEALAAQAPLWEPGTAHGYHAVTFGHLVGEVVRRVCGRSLGQFFAEQVAEPLDLEFWIGLPPALRPRVAPLVGGVVPRQEELDPALRALIEQFIGPETMLGRALTVNGALSDPACFGDPDLWSAELPAANGITNARSLARMYAGATGRLEGRSSGPLLTPDQVADARQVQSAGPDRCLMIETTFGSGFMVASSFAPFGAPTSFGHAGAGGSVGFADPEHGLGFGYVMNKMEHNLSGDPRSRSLVQATYEAIGVEPTFV